MEESTVILLVISRLSIRTSQIGFSATFILCYRLNNRKEAGYGCHTPFLESRVH